MKTSYHLAVLFNAETKRFKVEEFMLPPPFKIGSTVVFKGKSYKYAGCIQTPFDIHLELESKNKEPGPISATN